VPGDVIHVRLGDIVPEDARLLAGEPVEVDLPALTGESLPAERKSPRQFFPILIIREGEIDALVYAAGANTYLGKTAQLVKRRTQSIHSQCAVLKIGHYLIMLAVALVAVIIINIPRRSVPYDIAVLLSADRGRNSRDAEGAVGDDGGRRPWPSGNWPAWTCCAWIRQAP
jgi:P-type E1-E2 ATPase